MANEGVRRVRMGLTHRLHVGFVQIFGGCTFWVMKLGTVACPPFRKKM